MGELAAERIPARDRDWRTEMSVEFPTIPDLPEDPNEAWKVQQEYMQKMLMAQQQMNLETELHELKVKAEDKRADAVMSAIRAMNTSG
jgi:hypothetical protein